MQILIAPPKQKNETQGNQVTAVRWARLLEKLGHDVAVTSDPKVDAIMKIGPDLLIALHATRSAATIASTAKIFPQTAIVVIMTGTDLNVDLANGNPDDPKYRQALESLSSAAHIVLLEPAALELLRTIDARFADKAVVIPQSASMANPADAEINSLPSIFQDSNTFKVAVVGHLRAIKDPLAAAEAARLLPEESRVQVIQWGAALEKRFEEEAECETKKNRRYDWIGAVNHQQSLRQLRCCDVMVLSSHFEGGPAVLSEAIVNDLPIIAHEITATRGLLGKDYPGFYRDADRQQLADLILRSEQDLDFFKLLCHHGAGLKEKFSESSEKKAIKKLLTDVLS